MRINRPIRWRCRVEFRLVGRERILTCWGGPAQARAKRGAERSAPAGYRALSGILRLLDEADDDADAPIRRSWDAPALIALAVIVVWAVVAVVISQT